MLNRREVLSAIATISIGGTLLASSHYTEQTGGISSREWKEYVKSLPENHLYKMFFVVDSKELGMNHAEFPLDLITPRDEDRCVSITCCDSNGTMKHIEGDYIRIDANLTSPIKETIRDFIRSIPLVSGRVGRVAKKFDLEAIGVTGEIKTSDQNFCIFFNGYKYGLCCFDCRKIDLHITEKT
jgi:hypothetical protein